MRKIGFRTKPVLLRVIGSKNPVAQNVTGLLAAEYLKEDIASGILAKILTRDDLDREHIFATLFAVLQSRQSVSASA
jgi:hypothetical protein